MDYLEQKNTVIQNLKDAGCDRKTIEQFLYLQSEGKINDGLKILSDHRHQLLTAIHEGQKKIDILDYFIHTVKKREENI